MGKTVTSLEHSFQAQIKCRQIPPTEPLKKKKKKISNTPNPFYLICKCHLKIYI